MPKIPYSQLPPERLARERAYKRESRKKADKRRVVLYASTEDALLAARQRMPPGLSLSEYLSQLVDQIAAGRLAPRPPDPK